MLTWTAGTLADAAIALLAATLGLRFLLASHRLGGLAVLRLAGVGFLAIAAAAPLLTPSLTTPDYGPMAAVRVALQLVGFAAIGLGYLLLQRHGDAPDPGYGLAYQVLLVAALATVAPFVVFGVLHPVLRAVDEAAYAFTAALAALVAVRLARQAPAGTRRPLVALGFALLAAGQSVSAYIALELAPPGLVEGALADGFLLAGLLAFAGTLALEARERRARAVAQGG